MDGVCRVVPRATTDASARSSVDRRRLRPVVREPPSLSRVGHAHPGHFARAPSQLLSASRPSPHGCADPALDRGARAHAGAAGGAVPGGGVRRRAFGRAARRRPQSGKAGKAACTARHVTPPNHGGRAAAGEPSSGQCSLNAHGIVAGIPREALCRPDAGVNVATHNAARRRTRSRKPVKGEAAWTTCTAIILRTSRKE